MSFNSKTLFFAGLILCASGVISPPVALALGLLYGFCLVHPYQTDTRQLSRFLLQASVVGMGFGMNSRLIAAFGPEKVHELFNSDNQLQPSQWDEKGGRWTLSRTMVMTDTFSMARSKQIVFPNWEIIKPFAKDMLNVFADYAECNGSIVLRYDHIPGRPDDFMQALTYCRVAAVLERTTL